MTAAAITGGMNFPVIFFDGEQESDIGDVSIFPFTDYKTFQSMMSTKIGIAPQQFTTFLKHQNNPSRKIPITPKINFAAILNDREYYFFVSLKRQNNNRRKKSNKGNRNFNHHHHHAPAPDVMLVRRGDGVEALSLGGFGYLYLDPVEYEKRMKALDMERERYLANMGYYRDFDFRVEELEDEVVGKKENGVVCEECSRIKETGEEKEFHSCVHDAVTRQFKSPAGPIARPVKDNR